MSRTTALLLAGLVLGASTAAAVTDEGAEAVRAREMFQSLFGEEVAKVRATAAAGDELALAKRLLDVARDATDSPAFLAVLCDHAYALAFPHTAGKETAVVAMELLAEHVPDRTEEAQKRIARLREDGARADQDTEPGGERKGAAEPSTGPGDELDALLAEIEKKKQDGALIEATALYGKAKGMAKAAGDDRLGKIEAAAEAPRPPHPPRAPGPRRAGDAQKPPRQRLCPRGTRAPLPRQVGRPRTGRRGPGWHRG